MDDKLGANSSIQIKEQTKSDDLDACIDKKLAVLPLDTVENELVQKIIAAPSKDELQKQFDLFNINQSKKNALRVIKLNNLLDKVEDQAIERFEKRPDQVSNKELLDYMDVVSKQIDRAQQSVDGLSEMQSIHVTNQKNEVNINVGHELDRDSKEKVMNAVSKLLKAVQKLPDEPKSDVIDATVVEKHSAESSKKSEDPKDNFVYNIDEKSETEK